MQRKSWSREEQLLALHLYCCLPFGQLHQRNKEIVAVAEYIGRSPSAVAMKACNFASLDPALHRTGLGNVSASDRVLWGEFMENSASVIEQAEELYSKIGLLRAEQVSLQQSSDTETIREVKVRLVQGFFRKAVLLSYENRCAISGLEIPELLVASHIIPWSENKLRRADPTNGLALNALFDKAYDRGFITIDKHYRVRLSSAIREIESRHKVSPDLFSIEGQKITLPKRFLPDPIALNWHMENVFQH